jgi:hypothetical protein
MAEIASMIFIENPPWGMSDVMALR